MIAETIALGILSLPSALATLGMVPGVILIVGLGLIATYTGLFHSRLPTAMLIVLEATFLANSNLPTHMCTTWQMLAKLSAVQSYARFSVLLR